MSRKVTSAKTKTTTTKEVLYVVPTSNTGFWELLYVISTAGTETPKVYWYDKSKNTEYLILAGKNLGAGDYILFTEKVVVLQGGDEIRIEQVGTSSVTYVITVELIQDSTLQYQG
jgi:hypothetical protein